MKIFKRSAAALKSMLCLKYVGLDYINNYKYSNTLLRHCLRKQRRSMSRIASVIGEIKNKKGWLHCIVFLAAMNLVGIKQERKLGFHIGARKLKQ